MKKKSSPLVTICIPSFNHAKYVKKTILSVIDQNYKNIEFIIIDDGSRDDSINIIKSIKKKCIKRFRRFKLVQQKNVGINKTLNLAIKWAAGKYFAYVGSDDVFKKNKISLLVRIMEKKNNSNLAGIFGSYEIINKNGELIGVHINPVKNYNFSDIISWNYNLNTTGQLLRLELIKKLNGYKENLFFEDWYMWLKLASKGYELKSVSKIVAEYRLHEKNASKNILKMFRSRNLILKPYQKHALYNCSKSKNYLYTSIELSKKNKCYAKKLLFNSIAIYPKIILEYKFFLCITKILLPKFLLNNKLT